jgi:hypothetical protein
MLTALKLYLEDDTTTNGNLKVYRLLDSSLKTLFLIKNGTQEFFWMEGKCLMRQSSLQIVSPFSFCISQLSGTLCIPSLTIVAATTNLPELPGIFDEYLRTIYPNVLKKGKIKVLSSRMTFKIFSDLLPLLIYYEEDE